MNNNKIRTSRFITTAAGASLMVALSQMPTSAAQDPGEGRLATAVTTQNCRLERVELQYVRCDNLTGAGVTAPRWMPERPRVLEEAAIPNWRQPGTPRAPWPFAP